MRHCAGRVSDASPAHVAGWRHSGPARLRLDAGLASPALLHAMPRPVGRLDVDRGAPGGAVQVTSRDVVSGDTDHAGQLGFQSHEIHCCTVHGNPHPSHGSMITLKGFIQRCQSSVAVEPESCRLHREQGYRLLQGWRAKLKRFTADAIRLARSNSKGLWTDPEARPRGPSSGPKAGTGRHSPTLPGHIGGGQDGNPSPKAGSKTVFSGTREPR